MDINTIDISSVQMHLDKIKSKFKTYIDITLSETKVPFKVSVFKTSTSWRISELVDCAIEKYKNNQNISSAILTRAAMESTAALWYLRQNIVEALERKNIEKFDRIIMRMLLGWGKSKRLSGKRLFQFSKHNFYHRNAHHIF